MRRRVESSPPRATAIDRDELRSPEYRTKREILTADLRLALDLIEEQILIEGGHRPERDLPDGTRVRLSG
jgi:hypothetical protein